MKPKNRKNKSSEAVVILRIAQIHQLILKGYLKQDILRFASEQPWSVSVRQIETYISRATDMIQENIDLDAIRFSKEQVARLKMLLTRTLGKDEHSIALDVVKELNKMIGTYAPEKIAHQMDGKVEVKVEETKMPDLSKMSVEDLFKLADKLKNAE